MNFTDQMPQMTWKKSKFHHFQKSETIENKIKTDDTNKTFKNKIMFIIKKNMETKSSLNSLYG